MNSPETAVTDLTPGIRNSLRRRRRWGLFLLTAAVLSAATVRELKFSSNSSKTGAYFRINWIGPFSLSYVPDQRVVMSSLTLGERSSDPDATTVFVIAGRHNRFAVTDVEHPGFELGDIHWNVVHGR
jgi:hypothetical protein